MENQPDQPTTPPVQEAPIQEQPVPVPPPPIEQTPTMQTQTPTPPPPTEQVVQTPPPVDQTKPVQKRGFPKLLLLVIVVIILILVLGGGGYFILGQKSNAPTPTPTPEETSTQTQEISTPTPTIAENPTADWKTYNNLNAGYTVKYPTDWALVETQNNLKILPPGGTPVYANGPALQDPYLNIALLKAAGRGVEPIKTTSLTIGDINTDKYYETETKGIIKAVQSPDGNFVSVTFQLPQNQNDRSKIDSTFDSILSTFKFTN